MAPTGASQLTEKLPLELLGKVLAYVPILDILRMKQINRSFRDFIKNSPYTKYRIDLFTAGLEDNPAVNLTLADKRRAFDTHRMKWETFSTVKKWRRIVGGGYRARAPGVYAFVAPPAKFIEFLTLESISRGISRKEWRVPSPDPALSNLAINPHVDVLIVAIKREPGQYILHILSMKSGQPHPAAENPIIACPLIIEPEWHAGVILSISNTRLAVLLGPGTRGTKFVVWDWRTGRPMLELTNTFGHSLGFMDEYRVATILNSPGGDPARLLIFDTEQGEQITGSVETSFLLPTNTLRSSWFFWSEPCGHIPSPDELVSAPFYPDLSQRIFALTLLPLGPCYAFNTEELLRFAQERVNQNIEWREWRTHAIELVVGHHIHRWISGCRLFAIVPHGRGGEDTSLQIFDFSHACRAKNLLKPDGTRSNMRRVLPNPTGYELPCAVLDVRGVTTGHDSILFCIEQETFDGPAEPVTEELHVWSL